MNLLKFSAVLAMIALAGCQTVDPNSPEAKKRAEYDRLSLDMAVASCKLIVQLNQVRVAQSKEPTRDNRCAQILKNNSLKGGVHPANFVPDLAINGIPIPIGGLIKLAIVADRNQREKKAWETPLPQWVSSRGESGESVYRVLLSQGFKPEELEGLKNNANFPEATRVMVPAMKFAKENPEIVKQASR